MWRGIARNALHTQSRSPPVTHDLLLRISRVLALKPAKTSVSPRSPLGTFRAEERLRLSDGNSILMT